MSADQLQILTLSDLYPTPQRPAFGIFIERQVAHMNALANVTVVVPTRVFPHLRLWKQLHRPRAFKAEWQAWRDELATIPTNRLVNGVSTHYPRYTSLPRQLFHALWGFFAYPFLHKTLRALNSEQRFDLIHAHYATASGVLAMLARRWMDVPVVLSIHGSDVTYTAKQNALGGAIMRWVFRKVDLIIANSSWTANHIEQLGGDPGKIEVVRYGADPKRDLTRSTPGVGDSASGAITILSVGYLEDRKGQAYVLRALAQLRREGHNLRYVLVGDGTKEQALRELAQELGVEEIVSFEGYKAHEEVWSYFAECDFFVLPSWDEAFGVVYIEALSLGKAVIGCEGEGGPEDLKTLGDCIELVEPRDVDSLVEAMRRLITDPERRHTMGEIGQEIVRKHFTWQGNAEHTMQLYHKTIAQYGRGRGGVLNPSSVDQSRWRSER